MNINSTIISGSQAINDIRYLLTSRQHVLFVTDRNIVQQPGVQALLNQVKACVPAITLD